MKSCERVERLFEIRMKWYFRRVSIFPFHLYFFRLRSLSRFLLHFVHHIFSFRLCWLWMWQANKAARVADFCAFRLTTSNLCASLREQSIHPFRLIGFNSVVRRISFPSSLHSQRWANLNGMHTSVDRSSNVCFSCFQTKWKKKVLTFAFSRNIEARCTQASESSFFGYCFWCEMRLTV